MSCNCQSITPVAPDGSCLPLIADDCALSKNPTICKQCPSDDECLRSNQSDGTTLSSSWTDACCVSENVTILARIGDKLARFAGSGFIKLDTGIASVVSSVPIRLTSIWHRWWKPTPASPPILGEPLAYPYATVADTDGNVHAIKGPASENAVPHWNALAKEFTQKPVSEIELDRKGVILRANNIELVGYAPIADGGAVDAVRPMRALNGKGLVILSETATIDGTCECAPGAGVASKATTLADPIPAGSATYTLKFNAAQGKHWVED
jgi:hypothetical protein